MISPPTIPRVLTVSESDSCGAGGIQADIKTIHALGGYAMTALSAVAAQDTKGIVNLQTLEPKFVEQQMRLALEDIGADAIKTGILVKADVINAVGDVLDDYQDRNIPVVVDPSIVARDKQLLDEEAMAALKRRLFIRATLLTPNLPGAELLTGMKIRGLDEMRHATTMMRTLGAENVLLKARGLTREKALYLLATENGERIYERPIIDTKHILGARATLDSAIAVSLAQKMDIFDAVERSLDFLHQAILNAPRFATKSGAGPISHAFIPENKTRKTAS